ncbi:MAG: FapA family protein, partial [Candidatus Cloacimonetes bacterium]|nr:FapA family protein [Candidatus Cloacimonadota bacterium]
LVRFETRDFIAEETGFPYLDEQGRICILTQLEVDATTVPEGMVLRSPLSLSIKGNVKGVTIAGARSLRIIGDLTDSSVFCESDMEINGKIISCVNPGIQILGSLLVGGISHSRVYVKDSITFRGLVEHSTLACDGDILGEDPDSMIVGGLCQAGGSIQLANVGSPGGEETEVEIAISPFYRALLMQMTKESVRLRDEGDEAALDELHERIRRCETELDQQLNSFLKRPVDIKKSVRVSGEVYPRTLFRVLKHAYQIKSRQTGISLIEKE